MKVYKAKVSFLLGNSIILLFPLTLTVITLSKEQAVQSSEWIGLSGFWILGFLITLIPFGSKLEVGEDYIKTYLFGFVSTKKISSSDVQVLTYGNVFRGGLGFGKGISFRALQNGKSKGYSLSEKLYGKEAIAHVRRILERGREDGDTHSKVVSSVS